MKKLTKTQIAKIFQVDEKLIDKAISSYEITIKREREFVDKVLKPWLVRMEETERFRIDAKRYRWLRRKYGIGFETYLAEGITTENDLDEYIDTKINQEK